MNLETLTALIVVFGIFTFVLRRFFPILKIDNNLPEGVTGRNNAYFIWMPKEIPNWTAVLAQELYESKFKQNPKNWLKLIFQRGKFFREMELMGHAITISLSPDYEAYLSIHTKNLKEFYPEFNSWELDWIEEGLRRNKIPAATWVKNNNKLIQKFVDKRYEILGG